MALMKIGHILALLVIPTKVLASDITFNWLGSTSGEKSAISGECDQLNSKKTRCEISQVIVSHRLSQQDLQDKLQNLESQVDQELAGRSVAQWLKDSKMPCKELEKHKQRLDEADLKRFVRLCQKKTKTELMSYLTSETTKKSKTCKIKNINLGSFDFEKVGSNKWVSNNGPIGECGVINVMELTHDLNYKYLWEFQQKRIYTNTDSKLCKDLSDINKPMGFSWAAQKSIKMDCEYIEFGL